MTFAKQQIVSDFSAFADDEGQVLLESSGDLLYHRFGQDHQCKIRERDDGVLLVDDGRGELTYRDYLSHRLGQLDAFAQKILAHRVPDPFFVDGQARLESISSTSKSGNVLDILKEQCIDTSPFSSRVVFITADAGHGKTALLRQFQADTAARFLRGEAHFLFWHVDLQGRQLLRLSEALMGDLGELRITGLFMSSVLTLLRHRLLVLAIDGFDELAAEQGSTDALGALRVLLDQMDGRGTIVAAARRTFFNSETYARRTSLVIPQGTSRLSEFNEIRIKPWSKAEDERYLGKVSVDGIGFDSPPTTLTAIASALGGEPTHPILTTPFLFSHVAKGILRYKTPAQEFVSGMLNPAQGVPAVVTAFVKREVSDKWKSKDTGEPYLTVDQHLELLTSIAEEMWYSQVDRLSTEVIEALTALLLDQWKMPVERRRQVHEMVRMHVLLHRPDEAKDDSRTFEHSEFRNYFTARALWSYVVTLADTMVDRARDRVARFLSVGQLPDAAARYASILIDKGALRLHDVIQELCDIATREWRPTYLQLNIGTVVPWLLDGTSRSIVVSVYGKLVFSSVVFRNTRLTNVEFRQCTFVQTPFIGVRWCNVRFVDCTLSEVSFDLRATYDNVSFESCTMDGVALLDSDKEVDRAYSLKRIMQIARKVGLKIGTPEMESINTVVTNPTERNRFVARLLRAFRRSSGLTENRIRLKFPADQTEKVVNCILPLMEKHRLVRREDWHGKGVQDIWVLLRGVDEILRGDGDTSDDELRRFWEAVNAPER